MYDIYTTDTLKLFVHALARGENGVDYPRYYDMIHHGAVTTDEDVEQKAEEIENNILTKLKGM